MRHAKPMTRKQKIQRFPNTNIAFRGIEHDNLNSVDDLEIQILKNKNNLGAFYQIGLAQTVTQNEFIEGSKELSYPDVYNKQDLDLPFY